MFVDIFTDYESNRKASNIPDVISQCKEKYNAAPLRKVFYFIGELAKSYGLTDYHLNKLSKYYPEFIFKEGFPSNKSNLTLRYRYSSIHESTLDVVRRRLELYEYRDRTDFDIFDVQQILELSYPTIMQWMHRGIIDETMFSKTKIHTKDEKCHTAFSREGILKIAEKFERI